MTVSSKVVRAFAGANGLANAAYQCFDLPVGSINLSALCLLQHVRLPSFDGVPVIDAAAKGCGLIACESSVVIQGEVSYQAIAFDDFINETTSDKGVISGAIHS